MQSKNKTVMRSMEILNLFINHAKLTFNEIIELSGIPKTSVYRMLQSLEEMALIDKDQHGKYSLGILFLRFGHLVSERIDIRQVALPSMEKVHKATGEAVNLIIRDGDESVYIEKLQSIQPVRLYTTIGRRSPLYAGACPRAILSFLPAQEREDYLARVELIPYAKGTISTMEALRHSISEARNRGYTKSFSELEDYTAAIAVPIFDHRGDVVAALSVAGIETNYTEETLDDFIALAKEAAAEVSLKLGYSDS
ncbi:IclR family transcriptional regulator [Kurthia sibirica]|uniref:IclR family transcriptional regulator n=1 Tax=Kurthia sibirica TaxID=202750 RepID=A0A2U3APY6_9BACL|nr:IclR family transcriptional regulator [Kurthia sibirica]PWI26601.1 IclR family transcriptional regulator [Kurthia sibirica]GEK32859.1 HTH-type transcriptional regulator KipR [Kurthia sibirica]